MPFPISHDLLIQLYNTKPNAPTAAATPPAHAPNLAGAVGRAAKLPLFADVCVTVRTETEGVLVELDAFVVDEGEEADLEVAGVAKERPAPVVRPPVAAGV